MENSVNSTKSFNGSSTGKVTYKTLVSTAKIRTLKIAREKKLTTHKSSSGSLTEHKKNEKANIISNQSRFYEEEIKILNKKLSICNAQIEHYAFLTSHELRGPVATLKGLMTLYNSYYNNDITKDVIIEKIGETVDNLVESLKEVMKVLAEDDQKVDV